MRYITSIVRILQGYNNAQGNDAVLRNKYMHANYPVTPISSKSFPRCCALFCGHQSRVVG